LARIVAVADAFDAMVFDTPYRQGQPVEIAFAEIEKEQGRQFDPEVVTAFLQIRDKVVEQIHRLAKKKPDA
jgi:putative two-component system response regulator